MSDVFGLPEEGSAAQGPEWAAESPQEGETPQEVEKTEELYPGRPEPSEAPERPRDEHGRFIKAEPQPEEPTDQPVVGEPVPEEGLDQAEEEPAQVYAGKYKDVPGLEKGYRELRDLQRRTAERAKAYEQRVAEVEFQARQMEQAVKQATDYVRTLQQQQPQAPPPTLYDERGNPVQLPPPGLSQQQVQELIAAQTNEAMATQAQALQQQQWQREKYLEAQQAQANFFAAHPEVVKDSDVDNDIATTILAFNEAWQPMDGSTFNLGSEESLAIAYEASKRPALRTVLMKQPSLMDDDEGMVLARALADQIDHAGTQVATQPTGRMQARPNTPFAERGSSPAQPQATPLDEFDQAVAEYRGVSKNRGSKTFFGE